MDLTLIYELLQSPWMALALPLVGYFCWQNVHDYNDLADCVDAIGANKSCIFLPNRQAVTGDLTILETTGMKILQGGGFVVSAGKTLTINGWIDAGAYQIFFGDGDVVLGATAMASSFPEWWTD